MALIALVVVLTAVGMRLVDKSNEKQAKAQAKTWVATINARPYPTALRKVS